MIIVRNDTDEYLFFLTNPFNTYENIFKYFLKAYQNCRKNIFDNIYAFSSIFE